MCFVLIKGKWFGWGWIGNMGVNWGFGRNKSDKIRGADYGEDPHMGYSALRGTYQQSSVKILASFFRLFSLSLGPTPSSPFLFSHVNDYIPTRVNVHLVSPYKNIPKHLHIWSQYLLFLFLFNSWNFLYFFS